MHKPVTDKHRASGIDLRSVLHCCLPVVLSVLALAAASTVAGAEITADATPPPAQLLALFREWRAFAAPSFAAGVADYSSAIMTRKSADSRVLRDRLDKLDTTGWSKSARADVALVRAEMNGLDFNLRVLEPWARDPGFYATVYPFHSDVPAHEGQSAEPTIDLFAFRYPLSVADQRVLTRQLLSVPPLLAAARQNLAGGNAHDLWVYGVWRLRTQANALAALEKGTLELRTRSGRETGSLAGAGPALRRAVRNAREASASFAAWVETQAATKTGPSGVGKDAYTWYMHNVALSPFSWEEEVALLWRELERSNSALAFEALRNRGLPQLQPVDSAEQFTALQKRRFDKLVRFLIDKGITENEPYVATALEAQMLPYVPADKRNFFDKATHRDPMGIFVHDYHWLELERAGHFESADPIRREIPLYNIWDQRCEGLATALEEQLTNAGLYDDNPRGRELMWMMLANRAARGLAALYAQANIFTLAQAGAFQAKWTPRGWAAATGELASLEQSLYLRQPGYGASYIVGKALIERLLCEYTAQQLAAGKQSDPGALFRWMGREGYLPITLLEQELIETPERPAQEH